MAAAPPGRAGKGRPPLPALAVNAPPTPQDYLGAASDARTTVLAMEPERFVYASELLLQPVAFEEPAVAESPREYLRGYRDAAVHIFESVFQETRPAQAPEIEALRPRWTDGATTWGLAATNVVHTALSGRGVRIAVLDNGKPNARLLLTRAAEQLAARTGAAVTLVTDKGPGHNAATACSDQVLDRITKEVDLVLTGSAD